MSLRAAPPRALPAFLGAPPAAPEENARSAGRRFSGGTEIKVEGIFVGEELPRFRFSGQGGVSWAAAGASAWVSRTRRAPRTFGVPFCARAPDRGRGSRKAATEAAALPGRVRQTPGRRDNSMFAGFAHKPPTGLVLFTHQPLDFLRSPGAVFY